MHVMARRRVFWLYLVLAVSIPVAAGAQESEAPPEQPEQTEESAEFLDRTGFGVHLGTQGIGLSIAYRPLPWLTTRLAGSYAGFGFAVGDEPSTVYVSVRSLMVGLIGDIYPYEDDGFRVSAGLRYWGMSVSGASAITAATSVAGAGVRLETVPIAGYVGIGFGNAAAEHGSIGVVFDAGVILAGAKATSETDASGPLKVPILGDITPGTEFLLPWPVLSVSIAFRPGR